MKVPRNWWAAELEGDPRGLGIAAYTAEPPRLLIFRSREHARVWCRQANAAAAKGIRYYPVQIHLGVRNP